MKNAIRILCAGLVFGSFMALPATGFAQPPSSSLTGLLAGTAVPDHTLADETGLGTGTFGTMSATTAHNVNISGGGGTITNTDSFVNTSGIITVFQNTGNNSLFQSQTVVNVSVH